MSIDPGVSLDGEDDNERQVRLDWMIDEFRQLLAQQPSLVLHERATAERLRAGEAAIGAFVVHRAEQSATRVS